MERDAIAHALTLREDRRQGTTLRADLHWAHLMRHYVTGGDAGRLGPAATAVLVVLSAHADMKTGEIAGLGVAEIARLAGMARVTAMAALSDLQKADYAERVDDGTRGQRATWRVRHHVPIVDEGHEVIAVASWPYRPTEERAVHEALEKNLGRGVLGAGADVTIHQHVTVVQQIVEPGGIGVLNVGIGAPSANPDVIGRAIKWLAISSAGERMRWHQRALAMGAPLDSSLHPTRLGEWAGWIASDLLSEELCG